MREIILTLIVATSVIFTTSCSSDDNGGTKGQTKLEHKLIATWYDAIEGDVNKFTYNADGTSVYAIDFFNEFNERQILKGAWEVIDGNILMEYYPDEDESWDNDWKNHPDIKSDIEFTNNNSILLKNGNKYYKE